MANPQRPTVDVEHGAVDLVADESRLVRCSRIYSATPIEYGDGSTGSRTASGDSVEYGSTGSRTASGEGVENWVGGTRPSAREDVENRTTAVRSLVGDLSDSGDGDVTTRAGLLDGGGFCVEEERPGLPDDGPIFERRSSTEDRGTVFELTIVEAIVPAHGWQTAARDGPEGALGSRSLVSPSSPVDR